MRIPLNTEDDYESLLGQWSDLESGLSMLLHHPSSVQEFVPRVIQYDRWMCDLLGLDTEVSLYLLFQLAINSPVGYSTSHALISAVLCQLICDDFEFPAPERDALVRAALTMNIGMTTLQDALAKQTNPLEPDQQAAINTHAAKAARMLAQWGVTDAVWLEVVQLHHHKAMPDEQIQTWSTGRRLAHIVSVVDRYAAMISPRVSRQGRSALESARHILQFDIGPSPTIGQTLVRLIGLYPPGTFLQLDNHEIALAVRRGASAETPDVVAVINAQGHAIKPPRLYRTSRDGLSVRNALVAASIQERMDHHLILQLGLAHIK